MVGYTVKAELSGSLDELDQCKSKYGPKVWGLNNSMEDSTGFWDNMYMKNSGRISKSGTVNQEFVFGSSILEVSDSKEKLNNRQLDTQILN